MRPLNDEQLNAMRCVLLMAKGQAMCFTMKERKASVELFERWFKQQMKAYLREAA